MPIQPTSTVKESPSEAVQASSTSGHTLSGWAGIEDHLMKHDLGKINGYVVDIDTLLVFAGLFSAVLTAFVIETYSALQPDNMAITNELLAYGFALNLQEVPRPLDAYLNGLSSTFSPPTSARWINILFFNSLILSLAAAFFGILAKQWLREYLQWNSPLGSPRENVLVRQIRFEAFSAWNVASTISTIPALLEAAVILFFVGIVIFLWSLDDIVAICVTVVIVLFLGVVSAFTILPIVFRRCPYKSPTAWVCVTAYQFTATPVSFSYMRLKARLRILYARWKYLSSVSPSFFSRCRDLVMKDWYAYWVVIPHTDQPVDWPLRSRSWRERDLEGCTVTRLASRNWWSAAVDARLAAKLELRRESILLKEDGEYEWLPHAEDVDDETAESLLLSISETALLVRALSWMQQASQDPRVARFVDECVDSVHPPLPASLAGSTSQVHTVTNWCLITALKRGHFATPHLALSPPWSGKQPSSSTDTAVTAVRKFCDVRHVPRVSSPGSVFHNDLMRSDRDHADLHLSLERCTPHTERLVLRLLHANLQEFLRKLGRMEVQHMFGTHVEDEVRRIYESFSLLNRIAVERGMTGEGWYLDILRSVLRTSSPKLRFHAPALYLGAFQLACQYTLVAFSESEGKLTITPGSTGLPEYQSFLTAFFKEKPDSYSAMELNLFGFVSTKWLYHLRPPEADKINSVGLILEKMASVVEAVMARGGRETAGGSMPDDVVWITALWRNRDSFSARCGVPFRRLLHCFERCHGQAMLLGNGDTIWYYLRWCLQEAHKGVDVCANAGTDATCHWLKSHACGSAHCPAVALPPGSLHGSAHPAHREDDDRAKTSSTKVVTLFSPACIDGTAVDVKMRDIHRSRRWWLPHFVTHGSWGARTSLEEMKKGSELSNAP